MAVLGLHDARTAQITGSIKVGGTEIIGVSEGKLRQLRGNDVAMIFQDALTALHPFYPVGAQIAEAYKVHNHSATGARRASARSRCSTGSASRSRPGGSTTSRTSSPAACASA